MYVLSVYHVRLYKVYSGIIYVYHCIYTYMCNQHGIYVNYSLRMHTRMYLHMWSNDVKEFLPDGPSQSLPRWAPESHPPQARTPSGPALGSKPHWNACSMHHPGPEDNGYSMQNKRQTETTTSMTDSQESPKTQVKYQKLSRTGKPSWVETWTCVYSLKHKNVTHYDHYVYIIYINILYIII